MCGIAGILKIHPPGPEGASAPIPHPLEAIPEAWLDILDDAIKHRGPDGAGRFRDRAVRPDGTVVDIALVHRRLSIIDHAGGHQPMVHDGERLRPDLTYGPGDTPILAHEAAPGVPLVAVVFNGCIYNHRELRAELETSGRRFETDHSDTEVLVHGWLAWGLRIVDDLDGMHAELIWDRSTGQLGWGRGLAGEKPLYESWSIHSHHFCSSPPGLLKLFGREWPSWAQEQSGLVPYSVAKWVSGGSAYEQPTAISSQRVPFRMQVTPPSPTRGASEDSVVNKYNSEVLGRSGTLSVRSDSGVRLTIERAQDLLQRSVTTRLEADAPLGLFLSGGLDSALIAAIAHQSRPDIRAFTVRMPHPDYDESAAAAETAKAIGIDHTVLDCDPNPADDLVTLIEQLGLPFGDSSLLPTYWVCKAARAHVKVALSGDGGDELFGGYRRHTINLTLNRWRRLLRLIPTNLLDRRQPSSRPTYLARLATAARYGGYSELLAIFPTPDLRRLIATIDGQPTGDDTFQPVDDPLRYDFEHYLPDDLLRKTDTASMAVALEVRAPFLARELVDAALRTPLDILMPRGERKGLLKQVARQYLPDHIVDRPKQGFAIPIGDWFRADYGGLRQLLHDHLRAADPFPGLADAGVEINMRFVERMLAEHDAAGEKSLNPWHGRDHSQRLYMLLVLSIWAKWLDRVRKGQEKPAPLGAG
ncbi:MAG: asparagine synthase (glutamine-hydrolyzing) [Phycisphaerales bacterium]|nr:asparagine synthase (glutamine-hydrolyzing) [Planctomycetota bacterium]MCH8509822.1 asparagine synthase (glutamine-hydrolyzing) [Phycisphaerales bacterium]